MLLWKRKRTNSLSKEQPPFLKEYFWGWIPKWLKSKNQLTKWEYSWYQQFVEEGIDYNEDNEQHEDELRKLWNIAFNHKETPSNLKSKDWKTIGFQSENPRTDFRGGGIISLHWLIYFFTNYRNNKNEILDKNEDYFFLSISAINLCFALLKMLKFKELNGPKQLKTHECTNTQFKNFMGLFSQDKTTFYELHSHLLILLEANWQKEKSKSNANPLYGFNPALDETMKTCKLILDELKDDVSQIGELAAMNKHA